MNIALSSPTVQFLNHSCIIISDGETSILCDPWFKGSAFDDGWRLILEDSHDINALQFDWIWLSHEHPDHFSIATLADLKTPTRFFYQRTADGKVAAYLRSKGHTVREVESGQEIRFGKLGCTVFTCDGYDSALLVKFEDGSTFLNVNDARLEIGNVLREIVHNAPAPDCMAIQFSYANWAGNDGDIDLARDQHQSVVNRIQRVANELKPRQIVLFAGFIYFSHEENFYWNKKFWLKDVAKTLGQAFKVIVPMPDQTITVVELHQTELAHLNEQALDFWAARHHEIAPRDFSSPSIPLTSLRDSYDRFYDRIWQTNDLTLARQIKKHDFTLRVLLTDLSCAIEIGLFDRYFSQVSADNHDIQVSSNTADLLFRKPYARGTVSINSKIQFNYLTAHKFFVYFLIRHSPDERSIRSFWMENTPF
jgi:hypothetical protein